jgi:phosphoglycerol transferase
MYLKIKENSFKYIFLNEWRILAFGVIFSLLILNIITSHHLIPNIQSPLNYRSDNSFTLTIIQRIKEGWLINNSRSGYPFNSNYLDYPIPDFLELVTIKVISLFNASNITILNIFYYLGFILCFTSSYLVLRAFQLNVFFAFSCAILYNFVPFHFLRIHHLFYTWYFVIPCYIYVAYQCNFKEKLCSKDLLRYILGLIVLGTSGIYYGLFGIITISTAIIIRSIRNHSPNLLKLGIYVNCGIILGILLASSPYIIHKFKDTPNPTAVVRSPVESELYAFKMIQLILPQDKHRLQKFNALKKSYNEAFPLINENSTSSLGLIATIGFILAFISILLKLSDYPIEPRILFFSLLTFIYFLFGSMGSLGVIFSVLFTSLIRGWNRISIFINFTSLILVFLYLESFLQFFFKKKHIHTKNYIYLILSIALIVFGLYDQTPAGFYSERLQKNQDYILDKNFIESIEQHIEPNSPIYQLPYMQFPEVPNLYQLESYDLLSGFNYSKTLRWSYGGMKGRDGDIFYQNLSQQPLNTQIKTIKKMGFKGVYVDLRGYEDHGNTTILELTKLLGHALLIRQDNNVVFFKLN